MSKQTSINALFKALRDNGQGALKIVLGPGAKSIPYHTVYQDVVKLSGQLEALGITPEMRIGVMGDNKYEFIVLDMALLYLKAIPVHIASEDVDPIACIKNTGLNIIFTSKEISPEENLKVFDFSYLSELVNGAGAGSFSGPEMPTFHAQDVLTFNATSGTTLEPKFISVRTKSLDFLIGNIQQLFQFNERDSVLLFLPQHIFLQRCLLYLSIISMNKVTITNHLYSFAMLKREKPSIVIGPPLFFDKLKDYVQKKWEKDAVADTEKRYKVYEEIVGNNIRVFWTGAAKSDIKTLQFFNQLKHPIYEGYGMSEFGMISKNFPAAFKVGSVGKLFPGVKIKFDANNQILVKGNHLPSTSYFNGERYLDPEGYLHTGDIGHLDEQGFLFLQGRKKDTVVLSNGKKIEPSSIENLLNQHPDIERAFVFGSRKPFPVLLVFSNRIDLPELERQVDTMNRSLPTWKQIPRFKLIRDFHIDDLSGKKARKLITEKYGQQITDLYNSYVMK
jgi:Long-chain acyl-CoA synthetases (AMP-forming)